MIVVYATDATSQIRKPWDLDFRGIPIIAAEMAFGNKPMRGLTDCVWIVPGTLDLDA